MKNNEMRRVRSRYAPEKNMGIAFADFLLVVAGFLMSALIVNGAIVPWGLADMALVLIQGVWALVFFWGFEMYSSMLLKPQPILVTSILSAIYSFVLTFLVMFGVTRSLMFLPFLAVGNVLSFTMLCLWHIGLYYYYEKWTYRPKMLMVEKLTDDNSRVRRLKYECLSYYDAWYEHVDVEDKAAVEAFIANVLPNYDVICLMETIPFDIRNMFMEAGLAQNKEFYVVPMMYEMNFAKVKLAYLDDVMVFHLRPTRTSPVSLFLKRLMDIAISFAALAVAAIPMCIIAVLIKATSPGPVFYKQLRLTTYKK